MSNIHIASIGALRTCMHESLSYSCLRPDIRTQWIDYALQEWYHPMLQAGLANIPFCVVLDMGCRTVRQSNPFVSSGGEAPDYPLFQRYAQALDRFCHEGSVRDVIADISLHQQTEGVVAFLMQTLTPLSIEMPGVVTVDEGVVRELPAIRIPETNPRTHKYHDLFETFIRTFSEFVQHHTVKHTMASRTNDPILNDTDRCIILGTATRSDATSALDLELIERCLSMDDLPPFDADQQESVIQALQKLRLEIPLARSAKPEGGFVGMRNNGGIEEMGNPVISEWANPPSVLWEKLTNKRLLIYERASNAVNVRKMLLHMILAPHSRLLQFNPDLNCLPLREARHLIAAIARDLAAYMCRFQTMEAQLNIQLISHQPLDEPVRSIMLHDLTLDRIQAPRHYFLDHRDVFPWFFSTNLDDTPALYPTETNEIDQEAEYADILFDLAEPLIPERDITIGEHILGFENVHTLIVCAEEHYQAGREDIIAHIREYMDLSLTGLDSLIFLVYAMRKSSENRLRSDEAPAPTWKMDIVQQVHRDGHREYTGEGAANTLGLSEPMPAVELRDRIRRYFLARILGARYRQRGEWANRQMGKWANRRMGE